MAYTAKDGTIFESHRLYDVASANIGIRITRPDGTVKILADRLFAGYELADKKAEQLRDDFNTQLEERND